VGEGGVGCGAEHVVEDPVGDEVRLEGRLRRAPLPGVDKVELVAQLEDVLAVEGEGPQRAVGGAAELLLLSRRQVAQVGAAGEVKGVVSCDGGGLEGQLSVRDVRRIVLKLSKYCIGVLPRSSGKYWQYIGRLTASRLTKSGIECVILAWSSLFASSRAES
jgi:hypothetical protein